MAVRPMRSDERDAVVAMMGELWPDFDGDSAGQQVYVWQRDDGGLGGFASFSVRPWGDGCDTAPVPWVEGWWVAPDLRRRGVGRALLAAVEGWARAAGFRELGSDALADNTISHAAHGALGFEVTERVVMFRKKLR